MQHSLSMMGDSPRGSSFSFESLIYLRTALVVFALLSKWSLFSYPAKVSADEEGGPTTCLFWHSAGKIASEMSPCQPNSPSRHKLFYSFSLPQLSRLGLITYFFLALWRVLQSPSANFYIWSFLSVILKRPFPLG